jgi:hypothetical protein
MDAAHDVDAAALRRWADEAAREGRWDESLKQRARAIVRTFEERGLLVQRPGRTADEAAVELGAFAPESLPELVRMARWFDEVVFGKRPATREQADAVMALDQQLTRTRVNL